MTIPSKQPFTGTHRSSNSGNIMPYNYGGIDLHIDLRLDFFYSLCSYSTFTPYPTAEELTLSIITKLREFNARATNVTSGFYNQGLTGADKRHSESQLVTFSTSPHQPLLSHVNDSPNSRLIALHQYLIDIIASLPLPPPLTKVPNLLKPNNLTDEIGSADGNKNGDGLEDCLYIDTFDGLKRAQYKDCGEYRWYLLLSLQLLIQQRLDYNGSELTRSNTQGEELTVTNLLKEFSLQLDALLGKNQQNNPPNEQNVLDNNDIVLTFIFDAFLILLHSFVYNRSVRDLHREYAPWCYKDLPIIGRGNNCGSNNNNNEQGNRKTENDEKAEKTQHSGQNLSDLSQSNPLPPSSQPLSIGNKPPTGSKISISLGGFGAKKPLFPTTTNLTKPSMTASSSTGPNPKIGFGLGAVGSKLGTTVKPTTGVQPNPMIKKKTTSGWGDSDESDSDEGSNKGNRLGKPGKSSSGDSLNSAHNLAGNKAILAGDNGNAGKNDPEGGKNPFFELNGMLGGYFLSPVSARGFVLLGFIHQWMSEMVLGGLAVDKKYVDWLIQSQKKWKQKFGKGWANRDDGSNERCGELDESHTHEPNTQNQERNPLERGFNHATVTRTIFPSIASFAMVNVIHRAISCQKSGNELGQNNAQRKLKFNFSLQNMNLFAKVIYFFAILLNKTHFTSLIFTLSQWEYTLQFQQDFCNFGGLGLVKGMEDVHNPNDPSHTDKKNVTNEKSEQSAANPSQLHPKSLSLPFSTAHLSSLVSTLLLTHLFTTNALFQQDNILVDTPTHLFNGVRPEQLLESIGYEQTNEPVGLLDAAQTTNPKLQALLQCYSTTTVFNIEKTPLSQPKLEMYFLVREFCTKHKTNKSLTTSRNFDDSKSSQNNNPTGSIPSFYPLTTHFNNQDSHLSISIPDVVMESSHKADIEYLLRHIRTKTLFQNTLVDFNFSYSKSYNENIRPYLDCRSGEEFISQKCNVSYNPRLVKLPSRAATRGNDPKVGRQGTNDQDEKNGTHQYGQDNNADEQNGEIDSGRLFDVGIMLPHVVSSSVPMRRVNFDKDCKKKMDSHIEKDVQSDQFGQHSEMNEKDEPNKPENDYNRLTLVDYTDPILTTCPRAVIATLFETILPQNALTMLFHSLVRVVDGGKERRKSNDKIQNQNQNQNQLPPPIRLFFELFPIQTEQTPIFPFNPQETIKYPNQTIPFLSNLYISPNHLNELIECDNEINKFNNMLEEKSSKGNYQEVNSDQNHTSNPNVKRVIESQLQHSAYSVYDCYNLPSSGLTKPLQHVLTENHKSKKDCQHFLTNDQNCPKNNQQSPNNVEDAYFQADLAALLIDLQDITELTLAEEELYKDDMSTNYGERL
jgi:hypothetical protein